jgi:hypothetical protein
MMASSKITFGAKPTHLDRALPGWLTCDQWRSSGFGLANAAFPARAASDAVSKNTGCCIDLFFPAAGAVHEDAQIREDPKQADGAISAAGS